MNFLRLFFVLICLGLVCSCATTQDAEPEAARVTVTVVEVAPGVSGGLEVHGAACRIDAPAGLEGYHLVMRPKPGKASADVPGNWPPAVGDILVMPPVPENVVVLADETFVLEAIYPGVLDNIRPVELGTNEVPGETEE